MRAEGGQWEIELYDCSGRKKRGGALDLESKLSRLTSCGLTQPIV